LITQSNVFYLSWPPDDCGDLHVTTTNAYMLYLYLCHIFSQLIRLYNLNLKNYCEL